MCFSFLSRPCPVSAYCGKYVSTFLWMYSFPTGPLSFVRHLRRRTVASGIWISSPSMTTRGCLWVMALFSTAMFFLTFDTGFRLGEDEDGDGDTRNIALETKGVAALGIPRTFVHLRHWFHSHLHEARAQSPTNHLPAHIPIFVWCSVQNRSCRNQHARSQRVESNRKRQ